MINFLYAILELITTVLFFFGCPLMSLILWLLELCGISQANRYDDTFGWTVVCGIVTLAVATGIVWRVLR